MVNVTFSTELVIPSTMLFTLIALAAVVASRLTVPQAEISS